MPVYPCYLSEVKNAVVTGYTDGMIAGRWILNDRKDYNAFNIYEAARPVYCLAIDQARKNMLATEIKYSKVLDKALYISGRFPHNWWHFTFELLSRISLYDKDPRYDSWPVLIDDIADDDENNSKLLKLMNYKKRPVIKIKRNEHILVRRLAYASITVTEITGIYADFMEKNSSGDVYYFFSNRYSVSYIRKCVLKETGRNLQRKVFIARSRKGRLINESEIAEFLKSIGFEILYSDLYTFEEEIEAFSNAAVIISTMGAAMTNLVYASPGAKAVCIFPKKGVSALTLYQEIADMIGFKFYNQDAEIIKDSEKYPCMEYILPVKNCRRLCENLNLL